MATAGLTHSQVAVMLIDGALAFIAGNVQGKMPIKPELVANIDRASVGLKPSGQTLMYRVGETGVFLDMDGPVAMIWFVDGDFDRAISATDTMLKKYRSQQKSDAALSTPKERRRVYEVDLGGGRLAAVNLDYTEHGAERPRFRAHITANARK